MTVGLGMPAAPPPVLAPRRKTRQMMVARRRRRRRLPDRGAVDVHHHDLRRQRDPAADRRADRGRLRHRPGGLPSPGRRRRAAEIAKHSQIPVIADIHFQPKYVFAAIDAGCAAVRVNPGNIKAFDDRVGEIAKAAGDAGVSIRIGVNAGSLDKRLLAKYGKATPEALVESALKEAALFEEHGFRDFKITVKHNDPVIMVGPTSCWPSSATTRCTSASPRPARPSRAPSSPPSRSARCCPRASATPSGSRCRRRRSKRSRSACRSSSR